MRFEPGDFADGAEKRCDLAGAEATHVARVQAARELVTLSAKINAGEPAPGIAKQLAGIQTALVKADSLDAAFLFRGRLLRSLEQAKQKLNDAVLRKPSN